VIEQVRKPGIRMSTETVQFVVDETGKRTAVLIAVERYRELLEAQEELDCVREFDAAKALREEAIPFEQAIREIGESRK
jgi:hypothetical protein